MWLAGTNFVNNCTAGADLIPVQKNESQTYNGGHLACSHFTQTRTHGRHHTREENDTDTNLVDAEYVKVFFLEEDSLCAKKHMIAHTQLTDTPLRWGGGGPSG